MRWWVSPWRPSRLRCRTFDPFCWPTAAGAWSCSRPDIPAWRRTRTPPSSPTTSPSSRERRASTLSQVPETLGSYVYFLWSATDCFFMLLAEVSLLVILGPNHRILTSSFQKSNLSPFNTFLFVSTTFGKFQDKNVDRFKTQSSQTGEQTLGPLMWKMLSWIAQHCNYILKVQTTKNKTMKTTFPQHVTV